MGKQSVSLDFRLKNRWNKELFLDEIRQNDLISAKHKKDCKRLIYFEHCLIFISGVSACVSISAFVVLGNARSSVGINICGLTAETNKHKSIINKKKKMHDKTVLLAKAAWYTIEGLISKALIDSYISPDELF